MGNAIRKPKTTLWDTVDQGEYQKYQSIIGNYNDVKNEYGSDFDFKTWIAGFQDLNSTARAYFETLGDGKAEIDDLKNALSSVVVDVDNTGTVMDRVKGSVKGFFSAVGNAIKSIGTGLMDAGISLVINAIIAGLFKAGQAFYDFYTGATARNNLTEAVESWEESKSNIEALNSELETTQSRIDELQAKGYLSLTEQEELTQLQLQNAELERRLALEQQIEEAKHNAAVIAAKESIKTDKAYDFNIDENGMFVKHTDNVTTQQALGLYMDELEFVQKEQQQLKDELVTLEPDSNAYSNLEARIALYESNIATLKQTIGETYDELSSDMSYVWDEATGTVANGMESHVASFKMLRTRMDSLLGQTANTTTSAINTLFAKKEFSDVEEQLLNAGKIGSSAIKDIVEATPALKSALSDAGIQVNDLANHFMALANAGEYNIDEVTDQLKKAYGGAATEGSTLDVYRRSQMGKLLSSLSDNEISDLYDYVNANGIDLSQLGLEDVRQLVIDIKVNNQEALLDIEDVNASTTDLLSTVSSVNELLNSNTQGTSIDANTFSDETLTDYAEALEYVNGTYQLNRDKVKELTEAKVKEQIATNDARKALQQQRYAENTKEIAEYTAKLEQNKFEVGETAESIKELITANEEENDSIITKCTQLDIMNANLRESIGIYEQWKNAQNASNTGDMFDDAQTAWQEIRNVADKDSENYGRVGREQYQASVDFLVPEEIDHSDQEAVQDYLDSIRHYMTFDTDGNANGLDINTFLSDAVKNGLLVEKDGFYQTQGKISLEEFADGMKMTIPLVQAMFGEIQEFMPEGSEWFDWDEPVQTLGDLANVASEASSALSLDGLSVDLDLSQFDNAQDQIAHFESTIKQVQDYKATANLDSTQLQQANDIIQYCIQHIQMLESPVIMQVDTSLVEGALGATIDLLQQFQTLQEKRETQVAIGADTTEVDKEIAGVVEQIKGQKPEILAKVGIDPASTIDTTAIQTAIDAIDLPALVDMVPNPEAIIGYNPDEESPKKATVYYQVNDTAVQQYNPDNLTRYVYYHVQTVGDVPSGSSSGAHSLNGTAHAGGNWGTKTSSTALVGELGREIIVNPYTGKWYTVGDNGPEFTQIPKGSIVFNHLQTEELLSKGFVATRGMALAGGNAFANTGSVGINIPVASVTDAKTQRKDQNGTEANTKATNKNTAATQANTESNENLYDWIERMVTAFERTLQRYETLLSDETNWAGLRDQLRNLSISAINSQLPQYQQAYDYYMNKANSVGLSDNYKVLAQNGLINIEEIADENLRQKIEDYENWLGKARQLEDTIADLNIQLKELKMQRLDDVIDSTDTVTGYHQSFIDMFDASQEVLIASGEKASEALYNNYFAHYAEQRRYYAQEVSTLQEELDKLVADGTIVKYSDKWVEYDTKINEAKQSLYETNQAVAELENTILELKWSYFEDGIKTIENMEDALSGLADLIDDTMMFAKDSSALTGLGAAKIGLLQNQMTQARQKIANYSKAIRDLTIQYRRGEISQSEYEEGLAELQKSQLDAAKQLKDSKDAIIDYIKEGIDREVEAMRELKDARQEALDLQREYYEFNEKVKDQTSEIAKIDAQLAALRGSDSVEAQAKIRQLESQKAELEKELSDTQRDREQDLIDQGYDEFMEEFEQNAEDYKETLDSSIEAQNQAIESFLGNITAHSTDVYNGLNQLAEEYGFVISNSIVSTWQDAQKAVEDYAKAVGLIKLGSTTESQKDYYNALLSNTNKATVAPKATDKMRNLLDAYINGTLETEQARKVVQGGEEYLTKEPVIVTHKGVFLKMAEGSSVLNKELYELSKSVIPLQSIGLDSMISPAHLSDAVRVNTGSNEMNIHYDSVIGNIEYVDKNALPELETIIKKSFDYTVKELRKQTRKL